MRNLNNFGAELDKKKTAEALKKDELIKQLESEIEKLKKDNEELTKTLKEKSINVTTTEKPAVGAGSDTVPPPAS